MIAPRLAAAALLAAAGAAAQESVLDRPIEKEGWPVEVARRPLTLAEGMWELTVPLGVGLQRDHSGKPLTLAPSAYYGVSDALTVGLRHSQGLCLSGGPDCPKVYADVGIDALWRLWRGAFSDVAAGVALTASPITDPFALSAEVRLVARYRGGPASITVAPALDVGVTNRDTSRTRSEPLAFPLATTGFGFFAAQAGNREWLRIAATLAVQATPNVALAVAASLDGPLDPSGAGFSDLYAIPFGWALIVSPSNMLDLGASFTFLNLFGKQPPRADRTDARAMEVFVSFRR